MTAEAVANNDAKIEKREEYMIPLNMIDDDTNDQHRIDRDPEIAEWIKKNMSSIGQTDSIVLAKTGNGKFRVVAGFGRVAAAKQLNWPKIRAWIFSGTPSDAAVFALSSNLLRETLNPMEIAIGIDKAIKAGMTIEEVCKSIGRVDKSGAPDISWAKQYLDLLTLDADMQADISKDIMSMDVAKYLQRQEATIRRNIYSAMKKEVQVGVASVPKEKKEPKKEEKKESKKEAASVDDLLEPAGQSAAPITPPPIPEPEKQEKPKKMTKAVLEKAKKNAGVRNSSKFIGLRECESFEEHLTNLEASKFPTDPEEVRKLSIGILNWVRSLRKTYPV